MARADGSRAAEPSAGNSAEPDLTATGPAQRERAGGSRTGRDRTHARQLVQSELTRLGRRSKRCRQVGKQDKSFLTPRSSAQEGRKAVEPIEAQLAADVEVVRVVSERQHARVRVSTRIPVNDCPTCGFNRGEACAFLAADSVNIFAADEQDFVNQVERDWVVPVEDSA